MLLKIYDSRWTRGKRWLLLLEISLKVMIRNICKFLGDSYVLNVKIPSHTRIHTMNSLIVWTFEYVFDHLSILSCNRKVCTLLCFHKRRHLLRSAEFRTIEKSKPNWVKSSWVECFVGLNKSYAPLITRTFVPSRSANESRQVCITPSTATTGATRCLVCQRCLSTSRWNSNAMSIVIKIWPKIEFGLKIRVFKLF